VGCGRVTEDREGRVRVLERERDGIANAETHAEWAARRIRIVMSLHRGLCNVKSIDAGDQCCATYQATMAVPLGAADRSCAGVFAGG